MNDECLLIELDGLWGAAEGGVRVAEVAQSRALCAAVADLAFNHQCLLIELEGLAGGPAVRGLVERR